jgi:AraC-like DNA-binding protein
MLWLALGGETSFEQATRSVQLNAGDLMLYDQAQPFTLQFGKWSHAAMVTIPRRSLVSRVPNPTELLARRIAWNTPLASLAGELIQKLSRLDGTIPVRASHRLQSAMLDIWATALQMEIEVRLPALPTGQRQRLEKVKRRLLDHLGDAEINVTRIASENNMSVSTLMRLFAAEGQTPMRWLWQQRLQASYQTLSAQRSTKISAVAFAHGFADPSHFSRAFKRAFGVSPQHVQGRVTTLR